MNILLTGGTGLLGKKIGQLLVKNGHSVFAVTRNVEKAKLVAPYPAQWIACDLEKSTFTIPVGIKLDGVIHLAGESVGEGSWSKEQKERILSSRTKGTKNLLASLNLTSLNFFVSASAIGYYGPSDTSAVEDSPQGSNFLSEVTQSWENEIHKVPASVRTCVFRIGVVLSTEGGALPKMLFPAQIFASSALGSGRQWMSWIHIEDVARAFVSAAEEANYRGTYNLVAPEPVQQIEMARAIAQTIGAFMGPPVPRFMLKLLLGEQASLALDSYNVSSKKLQNQFTFMFPNLTMALKNLLSGWGSGIAVKKFEQYFDYPQERVFTFFSKTENLEKITPDTLNFKIKNQSTESIEEGTLINYSLKVHGFPIHWRTRIDNWEPPLEFTDLQLKGPYTRWHHTHTFEPLANGTLMTDIVEYKLPMGLLGRMAAQAFVDNDIENIFKYRREVVTKYL
jgi:uncharacterized protein